MNANALNVALVISDRLLPTTFAPAGPPEAWGPCDTADLLITGPDGTAWTVRVFRALDQPAPAERLAEGRYRFTDADGRLPDASPAAGGPGAIFYYGPDAAEPQGWECPGCGEVNPAQSFPCACCGRPIPVRTVPLAQIPETWAPIRPVPPRPMFDPADPETAATIATADRTRADTAAAEAARSFNRAGREQVREILAARYGAAIPVTEDMADAVLTAPCAGCTPSCTLRGTCRGQGSR